MYTFKTQHAWTLCMKPGNIEEQEQERKQNFTRIISNIITELPEGWVPCDALGMTMTMTLKMIMTMMMMMIWIDMM